MKVCIYSRKQFGKVNKIAVHQVVDNSRDIENAIYDAERDGFETICLYGEMKTPERVKAMRELGYAFCSKTINI